MSRKSSVWTFIFVLVLAVAFVASGCAKKQTVKEDSASKAAGAAKAQPKAEAAKPADKSKDAGPAKSAPSASGTAKAEAAKPARALPNPKDLTIWFAFDDYSLSPQAKENLEKIASWMSKNGQSKVQIQGNTCNLGTAEYNLALGDKRANSAKKYLEGLGVNSARLSTISYGLEKPMAPNTDEMNRSRNRRDEFVSK